MKTKCLLHSISNFTCYTVLHFSINIEINNNSLRINLKYNRKKGNLLASICLLGSKFLGIIRNAFL